MTRTLSARWLPRRRRRRCDAGSATLELSILTPALLLLLGFVVLVGRVAIAGQAVTSIAGQAARAASLARDAATAAAVAGQAARSAVTGQGLPCAGGGQVGVDTRGFAAAAQGAPAQTVTVTLSCQVQLADLAFPGLPGSRTLVDSAVSPIDPNRGPR